MSVKGNYFSPEFPKMYIDTVFKNMILEEDDPSLPEVHDENFELGRRYRIRLLTWLHEEFSSGRHSGKRLLDVGCGPSIIGAISSSKVFDEITMSDISENNISEIRKWLDGEPESFDWTPALAFVANLEGNGMSADNIARRVRKAVKYSKCYDIHDNIPMQNKVDCVIAILMMCTSSRDHEDFQNSINKIASSLRRPGGTVLFSFALNWSGYSLGGKEFHCINIDKEFVLGCLSEAGLDCMNIIEHVIPSEPNSSIVRSNLFVSAKVSSENRKRHFV